MKKVILSALVVFTGFASARSIQHVKLELKTSPILRPHGGKVTYVQVLGGGEVRGTACPVRMTVGGCESITLDTLNKRELRHIDRLIAKASKGELVDPNPGGVRCLAMPFQTSIYSANNGTLTLKSGNYPCGGSAINNTNAGLELIEILDGYASEYNEQRSEKADLVEELG